MTVATVAVAAPPRFRLAAFDLWQQQQAANWANYAPDAAGRFPLHSCSVTGHAGAAAFRAFIAPAVFPNTTRPGFPRVLDVGCGPQPLASYLEGIPPDRLWGIDPLPPVGAPHPFPFVQDYAERLPWPAGSFEVVLAATSLDHMIDPAAVVREVVRVLTPGGRFCIWCTLWPDAAPYDAADPPAALADACHAYHLGPWFLDLLEREGFRLERHRHDAGNSYLECVHP
jgi:SAM-dependent methyltransferase